MTTATVEPQATKGTKVTQLKQPTEKDVQEANEALKANLGRTWPDALDGRNHDKKITQPNKEEESTLSGEDIEEEITGKKQKEIAAVPKPKEEINNFIAKKMQEVEELEQQRKALNQQVSAIIEEVEAHGVNRHAFRYALRVKKLDPKQRESLDLSYTLTRQAIQLPMQTDWVDAD